MASEGQENGNEHEDIPILIVGGGICGLATALALHRKGLKSVVVEKSNILRATGGGIGILANGWHALDQLGVADHLRQSALPIEGERDVWIEKGKQERFRFVKGEFRWLKRNDLIQTLADALPPGTIRFGCEIKSLQMDPQFMRPTVHLSGGNSITTKVLIGCDGSKSVIGDFLGLKPAQKTDLYAVRGLSEYPDGHQFAIEFLRLRKNGIMLGRIPIDHNLVYWFVVQIKTRRGARLPDDPKQIKQLTLDTVSDFPADMVDLIEKSNPNSLSITHLRYRAPWDILFGSFYKGPITIAGDAMHVMGPFLVQGGSAGIEDAVVLARNLSNKIKIDFKEEEQVMAKDAEEAFRKFIKERRMRVVKLSLQSFLTGVLMETKYSVVKYFVVLFMLILFRDLSGHTNYVCGQL